MNNKEIENYNRLCAEFLGWKNLNDDSFPEYIDKLGNFYPLKELTFDSDWNWIMEVVDAIEKLGHTVDIWNNVCVIPHLKKSIGESKKEAVVQAINQFLIWYNENK
jgi:hypothetical protein